MCVGGVYNDVVDNKKCSPVLYQSRILQTPEEHCSKVKERNDMIADVLARHNIKLNVKLKDKK